MNKRSWYQFLNTKADREKLDIDRGYKFASAKLLKDGLKAVDYLQKKIEYSWIVDDYDNFDLGIQKAIWDFQKHIK